MVVRYSATVGEIFARCGTNGRALASAPSCDPFLNAANSERVRTTARTTLPKLAVTPHLDVESPHDPCRLLG